MRSTEISNIITKDKRRKQKIMRISKFDALIFEEIVFALQGLGENALVNILYKYKVISDKDVFEELKKFNLEFDYQKKDLEKAAEKEDEKEGEGKTGYPLTMIEIGFETFRLNFLSSISRDSFYDVNSNKIQHRLIINKDQSGRLFSCNTIVPFISKEAMEVEYGKLKKKLHYYNDIVFL